MIVAISKIRLTAKLDGTAFSFSSASGLSPRVRQIRSGEGRALLERQLQKLTSDLEIICNRMKIEAAVRNARAFLRIQEEFENPNKLPQATTGDYLQTLTKAGISGIPVLVDSELLVIVFLRCCELGLSNSDTSPSIT